jgi:hypothetical protein
MLEIDARYKGMAKSDRVKIELWVSRMQLSYHFSLNCYAIAPTQRMYGSEIGTYTLCYF